MGGFGSGCWERQTRKPLTEEFFALSIRDTAPFLRRGRGQYFLLRGKGLTVGVVTFTGAISISHQAKDGQIKTQNVSIVQVPCRFGGSRFWFVCPTCLRRYESLYSCQDVPLFRCRVCHNLVYPVQREPERLTLLRAAHKVRSRLGGDTEMETPIPSKPRGMHQSTYSCLSLKEHELLAKMWDADWHWLEKQMNSLRRLIAHP